MLNYSEMARDVGVSSPTAERWLCVLAASGIVYLLRPFYNNLTKRAIKTPKLYFLDTGLKEMREIDLIVERDGENNAVPVFYI